MADTQISFITHIYNLLTSDGVLKTITAKVYPVSAPEDTAFPYIVQSLDMRETDDPFPLRNGTLTLNLWDKGTNASKILNMRDAIIPLLDQLIFNTADISGCRLWLQTDGFVPDEPGTYHYVIMFSVRLYKASEAEAVLEREGYM